MNSVSPQYPQKIDKYLIEGVIGRGSMGMVYRARDPGIDRPVALKTLFKVVLGRDRARDNLFEKIRQEAKLAGALRNPHIISILDVGQDGDTPFVVMDLVEAKGLDTFIPKEKGIDAGRALPILEQVASTLDYAHQMGVIHRDIKPANILIGEGDFVSIVDFGVAALTHSALQDSAKGKSGQVVGSPGYMSPEQIRNEPLDGRADLFSLAVVSYEVLFGRRPFPGKTAIDVISRILNDPPLPVRALHPEFPDSVDDFFTQALAKDRAKRFSSGGEFITALRVVMADAAHARGDKNKQTVSSARIHKGVPDERHQALVKKAAATARAQTRLAVFALLFGVATIALGMFLMWTVYKVHSSPPTTQVQEYLVADPKTAARQLPSDKLVQLLEKGDLSEPRTLECIDELVQRKIPEAGDVLVAKLLDVRSAVRLRAISALSSLGDGVHVPSLLLHLDDRDTRIRFAIIDAVATLGDPKATAPLTAALKREKTIAGRKALKQAIEKLERRK